MITKEEVRGEVERLHTFISAWFRGDGELNDFGFEREFSSVLSSSFINIQPSGEVLSRDVLLGPIERAFGSNPDFAITVSDVEIRIGMSGEFCLATYLEFQQGAKNTVPADNYRRSTVLFEKVDGRLVWHHIHETACV